MTEEGGTESATETLTGRVEGDWGNGWGREGWEKERVNWQDRSPRRTLSSGSRAHLGRVDDTSENERLEHDPSHCRIITHTCTRRRRTSVHINYSRFRGGRNGAQWALLPPQTCDVCWTACMSRNCAYQYRQIIIIIITISVLVREFNVLFILFFLSCLLAFSFFLSFFFLTSHFQFFFDSDFQYKNYNHYCTLCINIKILTDTVADLILKC